ncbi:MAG: phytanoyl-CoA dioxygenase family protein [Candidatus Melainabacteria bacterium]|nr:phytanoyl-CoA dioxygenase family protein [Candidatus Melainabacteria bacterium]
MPLEYRILEGNSPNQTALTLITLASMIDLTHASFYDLATSKDFWLEMNPGFSISEKSSNAKHIVQAKQVNLDDKKLKLVQEQLQEEGYFKLDEVLPLEDMQRLAGLVSKIKAENWPSAFAFVYDESWELFFHLHGLLSILLGDKYQVIPAFWAFCVEPGAANTGWRPHRDRTRQTTVDKKGRSISLNAWIPITDADPMNGCMYILPAHQDVNYPNNLATMGVDNLQDVRAVPAKAGSVIMWNEAVYHWGGRSSKYAQHTRMAMALAFQRRDHSPFETPLLKCLELPSFESRLSLIAYQMLRYQAQGALSPVLRQLSVELARLGERLVVHDQGGPFYYDAMGEYTGEWRGI